MTSAITTGEAHARASSAVPVAWTRTVLTPGSSATVMLTMPFGKPHTPGPGKGLVDTGLEELGRAAGCDCGGGTRRGYCGGVKQHEVSAEQLGKIMAKEEVAGGQHQQFGTG